MSNEFFVLKKSHHSNFLNLKIPLECCQITLFHHVSTCSKKPSTSKFGSFHGFLVAGLPAVRRSVFSNAASFRLLTWISASVLCAVLLYRTHQHRSACAGTMPQQCSAKFKKFHQRLVASFVPVQVFQSRNNKLWVTCFWWQLTYDITIHIIRLSLKEGCFEISVERSQLSLAATWQRIRNPCLVDAGKSVFK